MNREQIKLHNHAIIEHIKTWLYAREAQRLEYIRFRVRPHKMGYKELANRLNTLELLSTRGNYWTFRSLYRMMQRQGIRLYDIKF